MEAATCGPIPGTSTSTICASTSAQVFATTRRSRSRFRVDLGYQLNPIPGLKVNGEEQTRRYRFHFSFGQAF